jgi:hypothetical protein
VEVRLLSPALCNSFEKGDLQRHPFFVGSYCARNLLWSSVRRFARERSRWPVLRLASSTGLFSGELKPNGAAAGVASLPKETYDHLVPCTGPCGFWEIGVDLLALRRSDLHPYALLTPNLPGEVTLNVATLDFDFQLGMDASLTRHTSAGWDCESRTMWIDKWSSSARVAGDLTLEGPGFQLGVSPGQFDVTYDSHLVGTELNVGYWLDGHCGAFFGIRWLRFADSLQVDELDLPLPGALAIDTSNDLIGLQVGRMISIADIGGFRARGIGKVGAYYNFVDTSISSVFLGPPIADTDYDAAFVGEATIEVAYCFNECFRIRAAYQVLAMSGITTATDQIASSDLSIGLAGINTNGLFADGGYIGLEWLR